MEDKINQLSDDVLVHILSFLTVKEASRTSILAKRWKDLWKYITRLDFDATDDVADNVAGNGWVVKWVNDALMKLDTSSQIDEFRVRLDGRKVDQKSIKMWNTYAMFREVQRLELDLLYNIGYKDIRYLRYSCSFPDPLRLRLRAMLREEPYSNYHGYQYLRDLCWKCVKVSGEALEWLMRKCALLERLVVHGSDVLVNLEVKGPSLKLKHLVICHCFNSRSIKVCDTINLVSLVVKAAGKLQVCNVPMLAEASVSDQDLQEDDHNYVSDVFSRLSCCLSQLEILSLDIGRDQIKKMELLEFPKLTKLKQLVLVAEAWHDESILGITSLMIACPFLQKFVMKLLWGIRVGATTYRRRNSYKKATDQSRLQHLKVVEIFGYYGCVNEIELLMYILENATALEKIIIDPSNQWPFVDDLMSLVHIHSEQRDQREELLGVIPQHVELVIL